MVSAFHLLSVYIFACAVFGEGLSGKATYAFQLVFCEPVSTEVWEQKLCTYIHVSVC